MLPGQENMGAITKIKKTRFPGIVAIPLRRLQPSPPVSSALACRFPVPHVGTIGPIYARFAVRRAGRRSLTFISRRVLFCFSSTLIAFLMSGTLTTAVVLPPRVPVVQYI